MRRDILNSILAVVVFTALLGLVYPLTVTAISQVVMPDRADGSMVTVNGKNVGSSLIAQAPRDSGDFYPRPSQTEYNPAGTFFNNGGPNNTTTRDLLVANGNEYLQRERRFNPKLTIRNVPIDALAGSGSGVDPHISEENAAIQARRVAFERRLPLATVQRLVSDNREGPSLGLFGEAGVNVLTLNIAIDAEVAR